MSSSSAVCSDMSNYFFLRQQDIKNKFLNMELISEALVYESFIHTFSAAFMTDHRCDTKSITKSMLPVAMYTRVPCILISLRHDGWFSEGNIIFENKDEIRFSSKLSPRTSMKLRPLLVWVHRRKTRKLAQFINIEHNIAESDIYCCLTAFVMAEWSIRYANSERI